MSYESGLSPRKRAFAGIMARGGTQAAAAAELGISDRQARRMYADPLVRAAIRDLQAEALDVATRRLVDGTGANLDTIKAIRDDPAMPPAIRLRAAQLWDAALWTARQQLTIEERLLALERAANGKP